MLFVSTIATPDGSFAIRERFGNEHHFKMSLCRLVAQIFGGHTGEELGANDVNVPNWLSAPDWPVPLTVILVVAHSNTRVPHFDAIEAELQKAVRSWRPDLATAQVKLVFAKKPAEVTVATDDELKAEAEISGRKVWSRETRLPHDRW